MQSFYNEKESILTGDKTNNKEEDEIKEVQYTKVIKVK